MFNSSGNKGLLVKFITSLLIAITAYFPTHTQSFAQTLTHPLVDNYPQADTNPPPSSPATKAPLGGGSGILISKNPDEIAQCTLTAIGHDSQGELIGFTAGHCADPGDLVAAQVNPKLGAVGQVVKVNTYLDYGVILFNPAKVAPLRTVGKTTLTSIEKDTNPEARVACKNGSSTGITCGLTWESTNTIYNSQMCIVTGDSGAPVYVGTTLIGMVNVYYVFGCFGPEAGTTIGAIIKDLGTSFTPV